MVKEGSADIAQDIQTENQADEELQKRLVPEPAPEDPQGKAHSQRTMFILVGLITVAFLLVFGYTAIRTEEVASVNDMTGHTVKGVIDERYQYNGFNFVQIDDIWYTEMVNRNRRLTIPLHYGPKDVETVTLTGEIDSRFIDAKLVYVTFNPLDHNLSYVAIANGELSLSLARAMGLKLKAACIQNATSPCAKQPILSCGADKEHAIVELRQANETSVTYMGNCVLIQGRDWELVKAVDRVLLKWYNIMQ